LTQLLERVQNLLAMSIRDSGKKPVGNDTENCRRQHDGEY